MLLRGILEEAAAGGASRDPVKQKIGDYYAACMDEKSVEAAGANAAASRPGANQRNAFPTRHSQGRRRTCWARAFCSTSSLTRISRTPPRSSRRSTRAAWAFPTATTISRRMRNPSELRQAYVAHVQKMLELLGDAPAVAATEAQSVLRIETALAKGSLTQVERRDPKLLYHKMSRQELESSARHSAGRSTLPGPANRDCARSMSPLRNSSRRWIRP